MRRIHNGESVSALFGTSDLEGEATAETVGDRVGELASHQFGDISGYS